MNHKAIVCNGLYQIAVDRGADNDWLHLNQSLQWWRLGHFQSGLDSLNRVSAANRDTFMACFSRMILNLDWKKGSVDESVACAEACLKQMHQQSQLNDMDIAVIHWNAARAFGWRANVLRDQNAANPMSQEHVARALEHLRMATALGKTNILKVTQLPQAAVTAIAAECQLDQTEPPQLRILSIPPDPRLLTGRNAQPKIPVTFGSAKN